MWIQNGLLSCIKGKSLMKNAQLIHANICTKKLNVLLGAQMESGFHVQNLTWFHRTAA